MNQKTDKNLLKSGFVRKASDDGLIHPSQYQGVIYSARNKRFFLLRIGKDDLIQSETTAIALSGEIIATTVAPLEYKAINTAFDDFNNRILTFNLSTFLMLLEEVMTSSNLSLVQLLQIPVVLTVLSGTALLVDGFSGIIDSLFLAN